MEALRREAERYLGTEIRLSEWDKAMAYAERKLKWMIAREGDAGGERRESWYLAQLVAETVRGSRISRLLELADRERKEFGVKKNSPRPKT